MTQFSSDKKARRGRVFPDHQLSSEEKAKRLAEEQAFYQRCWMIF